MSQIRYQLKQKVWSLAKTYFIRNEAGEAVYQIFGKPFSWGEKLSFQNMAGEELLRIHQTIVSLLPTFEIIENEMVVAEFRQEFSWLKKRFTLDIPGPNDYTIKGDFWAKDFVVERLGEVVATVSRDMWKIGDTYGVSILDTEDQELILATVVVVDLVCTRSS